MGFCTQVFFQNYLHRKHLAFQKLVLFCLLSLLSVGLFKVGLAIIFPNLSYLKSLVQHVKVERDIPIQIYSMYVFVFVSVCGANYGEYRQAFLKNKSIVSKFLLYNISPPAINFIHRLSGLSIYSPLNN